MTNLTTPTNRTSPARALASAATMAEHSEARWADWQRRGTQRDDAGLRRAWIIASVIGAGLVAWLLVTVG